MKPSDFKQLIKIIKESKLKRAILVESSPGVGKTQIVAQAAEELKIGFMAIHAPLLQPEDYGMPVVYGAKKDQLKFIVSSDKFPLEGSDCPEEGLFLIDELPQADASAQKILANLVQEREIHGHKIKKGWTIIATGNRQADRSGANRVLGHLANRMTRVELDISIDDWSVWALENNVPVELVSFIRFRPELLSDYDGKKDINATPRSWVEGVGERIGLVPTSLEFSVFKGDVGEGPASEFLAFLKIFRNLPNPDAIMMNPATEKVPTDPATQYALCGALSSKVTENNFERALTYVKRMPPEFSVLFINTARKKCPDIEATKAFINWCAKEGNALLS